MAKPRPVGRPSLSRSGASPRISFSLSAPVHILAESRAAKLGISVAELARRALVAFLS